MNETTSDSNEFNSNEGLNTLTHFLGFLLTVGGVRRPARGTLRYRREEIAHTCSARCGRSVAHPAGAG